MGGGGVSNVEKCDAGACKQIIEFAHTCFLSMDELPPLTFGIDRVRGDLYVAWEVVTWCVCMTIPAVF